MKFFRKSSTSDQLILLVEVVIKISENEIEIPCAKLKNILPACSPVNDKFLITKVIYVGEIRSLFTAV